MKFSVVVPVLDSEETLTECLESIIDQHRDTEIIVIDGGSNDETLGILNSYREHISYLESGKDDGICNAFNRGLSKADGDVIAVLNSDDYWEPGALSQVEDAFVQDGKVGIVHGWCRFHIAGQQSYVKKPHMKAMKRYMSAYHCTMFVRHDVYQRIGVYDEGFSLAMDSEWVHRALEKEVVFRELPVVLTNMRMGGVSDRKFIAALLEYRRSVIMHGLAARWYADLFMLLHIGSKLLNRVPGLLSMKLLFDKRFNKTVGD